MNAKPDYAWAALWRSKNKRDGLRTHVLYSNNVPKLFKTRRRTLWWIEQEYGYLRNRPDLRAEPHGWRMPIPVKVKIEVIK